MRTLHADLTAAQKATNRRPYLKVVVSDRNAGIRRLRPTLWYTGAEAAGPHAVAVPTDGSLNRLRIEANTLYRQRVASPTSGSTYSSWTSWRTTTKLCAIAKSGANLYAYAVDSGTPTQIYESTSADSGATWSAFALIITHAVTINYIAASAKSSTVRALVVNNGNNLSAYKYSASAWAAAVTTTDGEITPTGIALFYQSDWNIIVTGTIVTGGGARLASRIFGDGFSQAPNTWSPAWPINDTAPGSNVAYNNPFLFQPDVYRFTCREYYTGTGAYDRIVHSYSPPTADYADNLWHEPVPFDLGTDYGLAIAFTATAVYLTTPNRVYYWGLTLATLDVTADVIECSLNESTEPETSTILLDNHAGTYNAHATITKGAEVRISPGYYDANNVARYSDGPTVWIAALEHTFDSKGSATLTLRCENAFAHLSRWRAPRLIQFAAAAKNIFGLFMWLAARAGFEFSGTGSSATASNTYPALSINPGTSALAVAHRLLGRIPDIIYNRGEFLYLEEPLAADSSDQAFAWQPTTQHPIYTARYVDRLKDHNHFKVLGGALANVVGESIDFSEIPLHYASPALIADRELTTDTTTLNRALALARKEAGSFAREEAIEHYADQITAPVHCGLEVNDVIDITDSRRALSASKRRVLRAVLHYSRGRSRDPDYTHTLTLGAP